jgi:hypothetical protein
MGPLRRSDTASAIMKLADLPPGGYEVLERHGNGAIKRARLLAPASVQGFEIDRGQVELDEEGGLRRAPLRAGGRVDGARIPKGAVLMGTFPACFVPPEEYRFRGFAYQGGTPLCPFDRAGVLARDGAFRGVRFPAGTRIVVNCDFGDLSATLPCAWSVLGHALPAGAHVVVHAAHPVLAALDWVANVVTRRLHWAPRVEIRFPDPLSLTVAPAPLAPGSTLFLLRLDRKGAVVRAG